MSIPDINAETVPSGIFNLRKKRIAFSKEGIEFEKNNFFQNTEIKIGWQDIEHITYGLSWLTGYYFSGGLKFEFKIKTRQNKIHTISFLAIYGFGKQKLLLQFNNLIRWFWEFNLNQRADSLYDIFIKGDKIMLAPVEISKIGILIRKKLIPLDQIELLSYNGHFILQDRSDIKIHQKFIYLSDWDAVLVYPVLKQILAERGNGAA